MNNGIDTTSAKKGTRGMGLRTKFALIAIAQMVLMSGVLLWLYYRNAEQKAIEQYVEKARSVVLTTESTREQIGKLWDQGVYNSQQLRAWADAGEHGKVLAAVPVVTAMRAAQAKATEAGYEFRTPKFQPRNPKNEPDAIEARALHLFEKEDAQEYYEIDEAADAVRYFRPVRLTKECLLCHGDPATSQMVWGNDKGLDPTGARMEGWKEGEVHGAFEIVQSLKGAHAAIAATMWKAGGVVAGLGIGLALLATYLSGRTVTRDVVNPIKELVGGLTEASAQISDAASQVAGSSQELAQGASEQASSLEETSAALEEMSGMTRSNAESSQQAADLATKARIVAGESDATMNKLHEQVESMSKSAGEVSKIIKVIEEIAFQTNLLALNAAVEAARAGEHGKGFAVVAEEVRNLAQRSATAARDTAELISSSVERTREVSGIASGATKAMQGIVADVATIADLLGQISRASREQAQGVDQINGAASQMDRITQQNAAGAEESSAAAQELSAQAETMRALVVDLAASVGITVSTGNAPKPRRLTGSKPAPVASRKVPGKPGKAETQRPRSSAPGSDAPLPELAEF